MPRDTATSSMTPHLARIFPPDPKTSTLDHPHLIDSHCFRTLGPECLCDIPSMLETPLWFPHDLKKRPGSSSDACVSLPWLPVPSAPSAVSSDFLSPGQTPRALSGLLFRHIIWPFMGLSHSLLLRLPVLLGILKEKFAPP